MPTGLGDNEIISRVLQGEQSAYAELVTRYQNYIFTLTLRMIKSREDAEEVAQDVFIKAYRSLADFRGESKFSTWLYRICLNTILTQRRKVSRIDYTPSLEVHSPAVSNGYESTQDIQGLRQAIRQLAETDRAIISMNLDGYENAEIAELLGISNNHVAVKLHRIKQQLANTLKQLG
jgi:RNA polymerase sigma factor (sigma-70 family)